MTSNHYTNQLLDALIADSAQYRNLSHTAADLPADEAGRKNLIRSLMNVRMPKTPSAELLKLQDSYLQEELTAKGIVALSDIPTVREQYGNRYVGIDQISSADSLFFTDKISSDSRLAFTDTASFADSSFFTDKISLWQGDITRLQVGAIVNAANSQMLGCFIPCHRCIDNAIHSAAGIQLREECAHSMKKRRNRYGQNYEEPTGTAVLTKAYNLPCDYVIHTVGPIVYGALDDSLRQDLRNCYANVLQCCVDNGITSVAFCCISTGEFHFPNEDAARIALRATADFMASHEGCIERVIFNVFKDSDRMIYEKMLS